MPAPSTPAGEIVSLTSLRGIAAIFVVLLHADQVAGFAWTHTPLAFLDRGYLWVDLFFVLSGYVLSLSAGHRFAEGFDRSDAAAFLRRRFWRIYPLHLATLAAMLPVALLALLPGTATLGHEFGTRHLLQSLALVQAWGGADQLAWNMPSWSISAEWGAYILFPALAALAFGGTRARLMIPLLALLAVLALGLLTDGSLDTTYRFGLLRCLAGFLLGIAVFMGQREGVFPGLAYRDGAVLVGLIGTGAAILGLLPDLAALPVFAAMVLALSRNEGRMARALGAAPLVWLGTVSYSIYMLHWPVMRAGRMLCEALAPNDAAAAALASVAAVALTLALAGPAHRHVETRFRHGPGPGRAAARQGRPRLKAPAAPSRSPSGSAGGHCRGSRSSRNPPASGRA